MTITALVCAAILMPPPAFDIELPFKTTVVSLSAQEVGEYCALQHVTSRDACSFSHVIVLPLAGDDFTRTSDRTCLYVRERAKLLGWDGRTGGHYGDTESDSLPMIEGAGN
jgi:hypothetical protein